MQEQQQPPCKPLLRAKHTEVERFLRSLWDILCIEGAERKKKIWRNSKKRQQGEIPRGHGRAALLPRDKAKKTSLVLNGAEGDQCGEEMVSYSSSPAAPRETGTRTCPVTNRGSSEDHTTRSSLSPANGNNLQDNYWLSAGNRRDSTVTSCTFNSAQ